MNLDEMIAVMQGAKDGKRIQWRCVGCEEWSYSERISWSWDRFEYRIAPEPKKRLIRVEELPDVVWVKFKGGSCLQVVGMDEGELVYNGMDSLQRNKIERLHECGVKWAPSFKGPWKSFEVEE